MSDTSDKPTFQVTDYYELRALHTALWLARFAGHPVKPEVPGSPLLANVAKRIVEVLAEMEVARGKAKEARGWQIEIVPDGGLWDVIVENASTHPEIWKTWSWEKKREVAQIYLSPLVYTDEIRDEFVRQVDERCNDPTSEKGWPMQVVQDSLLWNALVQSASTHPEVWRTWSFQKKWTVAIPYLMPLIFESDVIDEFIRQVDERCLDTSNS
jgi:hypothetical protein